MFRRAAPTVAILLAFAGFVPSAHAACVGADLPMTAETRTQANEALFCLHNEERAKAGLQPFRWSTLLERSAGDHTADMVARGYFEHDSPEGVTPSDRMRDVGYGSDDFVWAAAENISWASGTQATPEATMDRWMNSPPHRANVLDPELRDIGFGILNGAPKPVAGAPPNAVTYTANFGMREVPDDSTVLSSPSGAPVAPPVDAETPIEPEPPVPGMAPTAPHEDAASPEHTNGTAKKAKKQKRKLKKCLRKAKKVKGKVARKKARSRCKKRYRRSRSSPAR